MRKRYEGANKYSQAERVLVLEYHFASKSFAAVRETFSNAYLTSIEQNNNTLVTKFRDTGSVCL
jgi:polysaccharide pyruvyl transferase WcaK-like protein